jgi:hypothetical protein
VGGGTPVAAIDGVRLGGQLFRGKEEVGTGWAAPVGCIAHWREGEEAREGEGRWEAVRCCGQGGKEAGWGLKWP